MLLDGVIETMPVAAHCMNYFYFVDVGLHNYLLWHVVDAVCLSKCTADSDIHDPLHQVRVHQLVCRPVPTKELQLLNRFQRRRPVLVLMVQRQHLRREVPLGIIPENKGSSSRITTDTVLVSERAAAKVGATTRTGTPGMIIRVPPIHRRIFHHTEPG